jgi:hypothetical protein
VLLVCAAAFAPTAEAKVTLLHDTFSATYRSPGAAVPTGAKARLRPRVTRERVKAVALRVEAGDPVTETATLRTIKLKRAGGFWTVTYRTPANPSLVSYSFRVTTAHGVLWYGDDDSGTDVRKGGTGKATRTRADSFQLTVYDRAFTTPAASATAIQATTLAEQRVRSSTGTSRRSSIRRGTRPWRTRVPPVSSTATSSAAISRE